MPPSHRLIAATAMLLATLPAQAAPYPTPQEADWTAHDFRFHTGEVMPEVKLHYTTLGNPSGDKVLVLHGTAGSGATMLNDAFAGQLFDPGQPLDATKYFIILPDALGTGKSTKPSDGLRGRFPVYDYTDMVNAQHRLLTEGLGVTHLRLVIGNSMGGMQAWQWGVTWPGFMDALVPMASQPTEMSARNWMLRRMLVETIKRDPAWQGGFYTTQPASLAIANVFFGIATSGGTLNYQAVAPTTAKANAFVDAALAAPPPPDANDFLWQWQSSAGFNVAPGLETITAQVLAINAADDERNPPETGTVVEALKHVKHGSLYLIPASTETRGHGTTGMAKFYIEPLRALLMDAPRLHE